MTRTEPPLEATLWATEPGAGPALVHAGCGLERWWIGDALWVHDGAALWVPVHRGVLRVPLDRVDLIARAGRRTVVWGSPRSWEIEDGQARCLGGRERVGLDSRVTRTPGGPWRQDGVALPVGGRRAADLQPFPRGVGSCWGADGFLYRATPGGVRPVAPLPASGKWWVGDCGAVLVGDADTWSRGAAPGRSARALPVSLSARMPVYWSPDGRWVSGADEAGCAVRVDLVSGHAEAARPGWTALAHDAALELQTGVVHVGEAVVAQGVREASWSHSGHLLAGPGGRVWDLRSGRSCFDSVRIEFGATVPVGDVFATVHWEHGRGAIVAPDGEVRATFRLPLVDGDVVAGVSGNADAACFCTALGRSWRVRATGETVEEAPCNKERRPEPPAWAQAMGLEGGALVDGVRWAWNTQGMLVADPPGPTRP